jgi:hypothetical protein
MAAMSDETRVEARWEWTLPDGIRVAATVDPQGRAESVFVADELVSTAPRGTRPEGHVLPSLPGVVVTFQSGALICILRREGEEIAPDRWPVRERLRPQPRPSPNGSSPVTILLVGLVLFVVGAVGVFTVRRWLGGGDDSIEGAMGGRFRAANGRFVVHHPMRLVPRRASMGAGLSGVVLSTSRATHVVVLVVDAAPDAPQDPWTAQKRLSAEAQVLVPRGEGAPEEVVRREETCVGRPGAVIVHRVRDTRGRPASLWSCGFVDRGAAYLAMTLAPEDISDAERDELRKIVEATELTQLAALGTSE